MIASSTEAFPSSRQLPAQPLQMSSLGGGVTIKPPPIWIDNVSCYTPAILTVSTWVQNNSIKKVSQNKKWKIISGGRCIRRFCHTRINIQSYLSFGHLHRNCSFQHGLSSRSKQVWSLTQLSSNFGGDEHCEAKVNEQLSALWFSKKPFIGWHRDKCVDWRSRSTQSPPQSGLTIYPPGY